MLPALHARLTAVLAAIGNGSEIVYVNDGSSDGSLDLLFKMQAAEPRTRIVQLTRNWGHQAALAAGLSVARGHAVVLMDADLQDPPELIPAMLAAWDGGAEVVIAERRSRRDAGLRGRLFPLFYRVLGYLSEYRIPLNAGIFGLLDRRAVDAINNMSEVNRYLPGLRAWVGFRTEVVHYDRAERAADKPKQSFWRLLRYGLDAIFSFSYKPLRLSLILGLMTAGAAFAGAVLFLVCRLMRIGLFGESVVVGYTSTIITVLFLGGVQLVCTGLLGEYLGRVYDEVKRRPLYLIHHIHEPQTVSELGGIVTARDSQ